MNDAIRPYPQQFGAEEIALVERQRFSIENPGGGTSSGGASGPFPFDVEFSAGSDASHRTAFIRPGTINGLVPTNILTTYDLAIGTTYYLVLSVVVADGEITSCTLSTPTTAPSGMPVILGEPPLSFDYVLGIMIGDGVDLTWYRTIGDGSIFAESYEVFRVSKVSPAPGTLPYDIYYSWALTGV